MWQFFDAHPLVFLVSLGLIIGTVVYVLRLLVHNCAWFRLGPTGLEAQRDGARADRPPGLLQRAREALTGRKRGVNEVDSSRPDALTPAEEVPEPTPSRGDVPQCRVGRKSPDTCRTGAEPTPTVPADPDV